MKFVVEDWLAPHEQRWPDSETGPWQVTVRWSLDDSGTPVATGVGIDLLDGSPVQPVTTRALRLLPLARIVNDARQQRFRRAGGDLVAALDADPDHDHSRGFVEELRAGSEAWAPEPRRGRPPHLTPDHYRDVARVYSTALALGQRPLQAVIKQFHTSQGTASRWVAAARDMEFLPRTDRGKAQGNRDLVTDDRGEGR